MFLLRDRLDEKIKLVLIVVCACTFKDEGLRKMKNIKKWEKNMENEKLKLLLNFLLFSSRIIYEERRVKPDGKNLE